MPCGLALQVQSARPGSVHGRRRKKPTGRVGSGDARIALKVREGKCTSPLPREGGGASSAPLSRLPHVHRAPPCKTPCTPPLHLLPRTTHLGKGCGRKKWACKDGGGHGRKKAFAPNGLGRKGRQTKQLVIRKSRRRWLEKRRKFL